MDKLGALASTLSVDLVTSPVFKGALASTHQLNYGGGAMLLRGFYWIFSISTDGVRAKVLNSTTLKLIGNQYD